MKRVHPHLTPNSPLTLGLMMLTLCITPTTRAETNINNGIPFDTLGHTSAEVDVAGNIDTDGSLFVTFQPDGGGPVQTDNIIFEYFNFIQIGSADPIHLAGTANGPEALSGTNQVTSTGSFLGTNGNTINWTAVSSIPAGQSRLNTTVTFDAATGTLGDLRFFNYADQDIGSEFDDDFLVVRGSAANNNLELITIDFNSAFGLAQSGSLHESQGLLNAMFLGFAADQYSDLLADNSFDFNPLVAFSLPGEIDTADLPAALHPTAGPGFGGVLGSDITTALAWEFNADATSAQISLSLSTIEQVTAIPEPATLTAAALLLGSTLTRRRRRHS